MAAILPILKATYPDAKCSLDFKNPLQLLVATILSAQCTDVRVNIVTKSLFKNHKSAADFANVSQEQLEKHAADYRELLERFTKNDFSTVELSRFEFLNDWIAQTKSSIV